MVKHWFFFKVESFIADSTSYRNSDTVNSFKAITLCVFKCLVASCFKVSFLKRSLTGTRSLNIFCGLELSLLSDSREYERCRVGSDGLKLRCFSFG